jgi:hypothetical protein
MQDEKKLVYSAGRKYEGFLRFSSNTSSGMGQSRICFILFAGNHRVVKCECVCVCVFVCVCVVVCLCV